MLQEVYVFQSPNFGRFSSGVFSTKEGAEEWIKKHSLSGILTAYPVDEGVYDWAIRMGHFVPKKDKELSSEFIGGFSSASQSHFHYENGDLLD